MMNTRRITAKIVGVIFVALAAAGVVWLLSRYGITPSDISPSIFYGAILVLAGFWLINILSNLSLKLLLPRAGNRAFTAANLLKFSGYVILAIAALAAFGVSPEVAIAGGTFSGLVIGLGAQAVLSNFFAGLVLIATGVLKAGDEIRLVSGSLPYQPASTMGYKFFSPDYINVGYKGRVVELGLLFSTMTTDTGLELKIPNQIILNSAIMGYTPSHSLARQLQVRYEFKIDLDPDLVLEQVKRALGDMKQVGRITINEQSSQEYYILLVEFEVPIGEDWALLKSEILRRLVKVHRSLKLKND
jgi:small-conductance mechanosensitive channel